MGYHELLTPSKEFKKHQNIFNVLKEKKTKPNFVNLNSISSENFLYQ